VTPASLRVLRKYADNTMLAIGGQSGSDAVLAAAKRGHDVDAIERAVRYCIELGFEPSVDFLFGLPGETDDDARASLELARRLTELGARIHAHTFLPLPGTPFRNAQPGVLSPTIKAGLDPLVGRGHVHGQWIAQERLANQLVPFVRRPAK
jgi:radical SAM superfamily enzyme YgiQ (UPF0313 family)